MSFDYEMLPYRKARGAAHVLRTLAEAAFLTALAYALTRMVA